MHSTFEAAYLVELRGCVSQSLDVGRVRRPAARCEKFPGFVAGLLRSITGGVGVGVGPLPHLGHSAVHRGQQAQQCALIPPACMPCCSCIVFQTLFARLR